MSAQEMSLPSATVLKGERQHASAGARRGGRPLRGNGARTRTQDSREQDSGAALSCCAGRIRQKRGQVEMVGLVIVVALLVLGIVLYMSFSARMDKTQSAALRTQGDSSFRAAFAGADTACGVRVWELAQACAMEKPIGVCQDSCDELQHAMDIVAGAALHGRYNLSLQGTGVQNESGCPSADQRLTGVLEVNQPIPTVSPMTVNLTLALCR